MSIKFRAKTAQGFTIDSPLQPFTFPDGAAHIKGADAETKYEYQIADIRGLSHDDLFTLAMWVDVCDQREEPTVVFLPYLPGARMDRGLPFGASVYAEFLTNLFIDQIITLDPHSEIMPGLIRNYTSPNVPKTVENVTVFPFSRIIKHEIQSSESDSRPQPYAGVIAPDKGARDRAAQAARVMGVPVYTAGKTRDFETGKLTGFHMEDELPAEGKFLIVDDICDGGGTFNGLAEAINIGRDRLDLWVTHGIFSKGVHTLFSDFGAVHTTNSYHHGASFTLEDYADFRVHDITPYLYAAIDVK